MWDDKSNFWRILRLRNRWAVTVVDSWGKVCRLGLQSRDREMLVLKLGFCVLGL